MILLSIDTKIATHTHVSCIHTSVNEHLIITQLYSSSKTRPVLAS